MKLKDFCLLLFLYLILFLFGTVMYVASFHSILFQNIDVFFYRGLITILFWGIIISLMMFGLRFKFKNLITVRDILLLFVAFCCVNVVVFTHLPVTADRSVTVFMLGYMADHDTQSFTEEEIKDHFVDTYVTKYGAFSKRFHEQEETGTIRATGNGDDGKYQITDEGKFLMKIYEMTANLYNLDDKLIHSGQN